MCLENGESYEKLVIKKTETNDGILVSRYSMQNPKEWIEEKEQEVLEEEFSDRRICLDYHL
jgi:hypothetical protein